MENPDSIHKGTQTPIRSESRSKRRKKNTYDTFFVVYFWHITLNVQIYTEMEKDVIPNNV